MIINIERTGEKGERVIRPTLLLPGLQRLAGMVIAKLDSLKETVSSKIQNVKNK